MTIKRFRLSIEDPSDVLDGVVRFAPWKALWFTGNLIAGLVGTVLLFSWSGLLVFLCLSWLILLFGHSLGTHRRLIHRSFDCPTWVEYTLVYLGCLVGLKGPISLVKEHDLREDMAQQMPQCHDYLAWRGPLLKDAWRQLFCDLHLDRPPRFHLEPAITQDRFYRFLEQTWMLQQLPVAILLYLAGGWSFVFFGSFLRVASSIAGHFLTSHLVHNTGGEHYLTAGAGAHCRNVPQLSLLAMGECWHNNHHAYPWSAKHSLFPGEWDLGWVALLGLKRLGLVSHLQVPDDFPERKSLLTVTDLGRKRSAPARYTLSDPRFVANDCQSLLRTIRTIGATDIKVVTPASVMSVAGIRLFGGANINVELDRRSTLFVVETGNAFIRGLPAASMILAAKGSYWYLLARILLPATIVAEKLRDFFRAAEPRPA